MIVAVEAPPGGGKGFLLKHLQARGVPGLRVALLDDDISSLLDCQNDPARWGLVTQLSVFAAHIDMQNQERPVADALVMEGSHHSDAECHARLATMHPQERALYDEATSILRATLREPVGLVVYLKSDLHTCFERIVSSARKEQTGISLQAVAQHLAAYEDFVATCPVPVVELDCPAYFEDNEPLVTALADRVLAALREA